MSAGLRVALVLAGDGDTARALSLVDELRARGHEVVAVLPGRAGDARAALTERGVPVLRSPSDFRLQPVGSGLAGLFRFHRTLRELAPDVLCCEDAPMTRLASIRLGIPVVYLTTGLLESPVLRAAERRLSRLDTMTVVPSEYAARHYRDAGRTVAQTPVVPYGVDLEHFQPLSPGVRQHLRQRLEITHTGLVAIMVARVHPPGRPAYAGCSRKGHDVLLDAWRGFHAEYPDSHLIVIGDGVDAAGERHRQELIRRFRTDLADSGVTWIDAVEDIRPYYAAADVNVSPSRSDEGGSVCEACAMGVPSIVSDAGGLPETVTAGSGWVFHGGDSTALGAALRSACAEHGNGELAARGASARQLAVGRFDARRMSVALADVVERAARRLPTVPELRPRVVSIFTESRFGRRPDGRWTALDPYTWGEKWDRYALDGNQVRVVAQGDQRRIAESPPVPGGLTVVPLPCYTGSSSLLRNLPSLVAAVARAVVEADTVVLRVPGVVGSIAGVVCRLLRTDYAVEVVADPADGLRAGVFGPLGRRLIPLAERHLRWLVRGASASLYATHQTLQRRYPRRPGTPTIGMSNVVLRPGTLAAHSRVWQPPPFRVVTIGNQENHYKGQDVLLRALRELVEDGLDVTATIIGGGRLHGELIELAHALGVASRVVFTGVLDDRACIRELLDSASLFAQPSRAEGMPRALIEAMARSLPAVGTRVGAIPELLPSFCLVPVDDHRALARAMRDLLTDREAWEEQSRDNLKIAQSFEQTLLEHQFSAWLDRVPSAWHVS
ncbi:glycosyltransferase [Amycolatopsis taiwanensis]|uniref:glycosyltransferase n=1 Tax=Amycolatopsis taiwanensis TaxID=342230 RepID=UPI0006931D6A|nr:glycosyltransferase [Amycolatopsis taiwanensis]